MLDYKELLDVEHFESYQCRNSIVHHFEMVQGSYHPESLHTDLVPYRTILYRDLSILLTGMLQVRYVCPILNCTNLVPKWYQFSIRRTLDQNRVVSPMGREVSRFLHEGLFAILSCLNGYLGRAS